MSHCKLVQARVPLLLGSLVLAGFNFLIPGIFFLCQLSLVHLISSLQNFVNSSFLFILFLTSYVLLGVRLLKMARPRTAILMGFPTAVKVNACIQCALFNQKCLQLESLFTYCTYMLKNTLFTLFFGLYRFFFAVN